MDGIAKITSHSPKPAGAAPTVSSDRHNQLVKQSEKLVAQTFFGTLLKQMRNSPFKSKLFDGGRGGEAFSSMLDQRLADHMVHGAGHKLVNSMVKRIERSTDAKQEARDAKKTSRQATLERSGYMKRPGRERRQHVPADFRA